MRKMKTVVAVLMAACILLSGFGTLAEISTTATGAGSSGKEVAGTVLSVSSNDIMIKMENGNVFNFIMDNITDTIAQVGDEVVIEYAGHLDYSYQGVSGHHHFRKSAPA